MRLVTHKTVPTLKRVGEGYTVEKHTVMYVTAGTEFANRKDVREAIEAGLRGEVQSLRWGQWIDYPFIIANTSKKTGEYSEYIRFYPPSEAQLEHFNLAPRTEWLVNGVPSSQEAAIALCGSQAESSDEPCNCMTIAVNNIVSIG